MHDLDRTDLELEEEFEDDSLEEMEFEEEFEGEFESESPFTDSEEVDLATELMDVTGDDELEMFLGKLFKKASRAVRRVLPKQVRRSLGGILKGVAKRALPLAGTAAGTFFGGPAGAAIGGKLGSMASKIFGLEMEGLSDDELEFEAAKKFVRLAGTAAAKAANTGTYVHPKVAAKKAVISAASKHAPGLIKGGLTFSGTPHRSGRWIKRGRKIIVMGV